MGLTVSFNECFKRDTRCNANNISRIINTFQADSSTHNASDDLLYCTEQFKEAEILLRSSLGLFHENLLKRRGNIKLFPEFLSNTPHISLETNHHDE